jgi:hypothetical protein
MTHNNSPESPISLTTTNPIVQPTFCKNPNLPTNQWNWQNASRLDTVFANPLAIPLVSNPQINVAATINQHATIQFTLTLPTISRVPHYLPPKPFPLTNVPDKPPYTTDQLDHIYFDFYNSLYYLDTEYAWSLLSRVAQDYLNSYSASYFERIPWTKPTYADPYNRPNPTNPIDHTINQLRELKLIYSKIEMPNYTITESHIDSITSLRESLTTKLNHISPTPTSSTQCQTIINTLLPLQQHQKQQETHARINNWKTNLQQNKNKCYTYLKYKHATRLRAINHNNQTTVHPVDILDAITTNWGNILTQQPPDFAPFQHEYEPEIRATSKPFHLTPITADNLLHTLTFKKNRSSAGTDGWRFIELKRLPKQWFVYLADLYNTIENTEAPWPSTCNFTPITSLAKTQGTSDPLNIRPIAILPIIYNLYASCRFKSTIPWQKQTIHPNSFGGLPNKNTFIPTSTEYLRIETAKLLGLDHSGLSYDRSKCFDRIHSTFTNQLLSKLGFPNQITTATSKFYSQNSRFFKLNNICGKQFKSTALFQGCPLSVLSINALFTILLKRLERDKLFNIYIYIDDLAISTSATTTESLKEADKQCTTFDLLTGQVINLNKAITYTTSRNTRDHLRHDLPNYKLTDTFKTLGFAIKTAHAHLNSIQNTQAKKAASSIDDIKLLPITPARKMALLTTIAMPKLTYGSIFTIASLAVINQIGSQSSVCI